MYKTSQLIDRVCETCFHPFKARPYQVKTGNGRFCSPRCRALRQPREDLPTRLWGKVDKSGGDAACWIWTGYRNEDGYGKIGTGGRSNDSTHRVAYTLTYGPIPEQMRVLHRCDNPICCNPVHLFLGTQADNVADMMQKQRGVAHKGEKAPGAKLSAVQVEEIKAQYTGKRGEKLALAYKYGVCIQSICNILNGATWT